MTPTDLTNPSQVTFELGLTGTNEGDDTLKRVTAGTQDRRG